MSPPSSPPPRKKPRPHLPYHLSLLPQTLRYTQSFMHATPLTHLLPLPPNHILTASQDGQLSLWHYPPFTFIKSFSLPFPPLSLSPSPSLPFVLALTKSSLSLLSIPAYDLVAVIQLDFEATVACFVADTDAGQFVLVGGKDGIVRAYSGDALDFCGIVDTPHQFNVTVLSWNTPVKCIISADEKGVLDYWTLEKSKSDGRSFKSGLVPGLKYTSKSRTDLYFYAQKKLDVGSVQVSKGGAKFVVCGGDFCVRVFDFWKGKIVRECVAGGEVGVGRGVGGEEWGRRLAREKEVVGEGGGGGVWNGVFDPSGRFVLFASVVGIHVLEVESGKEVRVFGERESAERFLRVGLIEGEEEGGALLLATGFRSQRVYLFNSEEVKEGRDVFNERPMVKGGKVGGGGGALGREMERGNAVVEKVTLHTSEGDIVIKLFGKVAPKTVENFVGHARSGYFDECVFHRVIKGFMLQTGDPGGDGTGGESIWGGEFEDEIDASVQHEVGTVSMANAGPNTNGSQFFITCEATPHLDGKHTIFGKVMKGMEVVRQIEKVKTDKRDRPLTTISIESVSVHAE